MSLRLVSAPCRALVVALLVVGLVAAGCGTQKATWQAGTRSSTSPLPIPSSPSAMPTTPSPTPTPSATPAGTPETACVNSVLAGMSLKQIVGQVMLVGTPVNTPKDIEKTISEYDIGGVFLAGRSTQSASQLRSSIKALQATATSPKGVKLFISLDQEGGEVQTLKGSDFPLIPTAVDQGKLSQSALHAQAVSWAHRLASVGINLDLAPVADTVPASLGTKNPPIGAFYREYGSDPTAVAADITTVVGAVQSTGVMTTLKHFPGLGRTLVNTDVGTGAEDSVTTAHDPYLGPFSAGIKAGTGAVMVSSATYPKLDPNEIASFSPAIMTGLLRHQLGFTGMIVSDSYAGAAAVASTPLSQRAVRFIEAGGDFALVTTYTKAPTMISGLLAEAKASSSFRTKVTAAAGYVLRAKYQAGLLSCSP